MILLQKRLEAAGFNVVRYSYQSVSRTIQENAEGLRFFLRERGLSACSFVCHSYGGLVVCKYLGSLYNGRPVKVVFMGTPLNGATLARRLEALSFVRLITGHSLTPLKEGCKPGLLHHRCIMIAGSLNIGLGMFFFKARADGMVKIEDTQAFWLERHHVLRCSNLALLFSKRASRICIEYLNQY